MPSAEQVNPSRWTKKTVLFDDGAYSVICGDYTDQHGKAMRRLGERWNVGLGGPDAPGFPTYAGHPIWHVVPDFLVRPVLLGVLAELARRPDIPKWADYVNDTMDVLGDPPPPAQHHAST